MKSSLRIPATAALALSVVIVALVWMPERIEDARTSVPGDMRRGAADGFNILLVTLDTTRADHLGCYGRANAETPTLDALADRGVRFTNAVTTAPVTLPSHASILTGLYPPNHGVRNNAEFRLENGHVTLAEILREHGYQTAAFVASFVLDGRFGLDQGFDLYDDVMPTPQRGFGQDQERPADVVSGSAIAWLTERDSTKPFFAWVHYYDPHYPHQAHDPKFERYPYDGEIAFMDRHLGRLLQALDEQDLRSRTLIVVVGDHGESLGEHQESGHSRLIYEAAMHVPLIVHCPGLIRRDVVDDVVVSVTDVFPTILDLIGLQHFGPCDGVSLLDAREQGDRAVYMETMVTYLDNGWAPLYALRTRGQKFIHAPRPEFYDLLSDPHETANLYDEVAAADLDTLRRLESELDQMLAGWPAPEAVAAAADALDPETTDRLESLGYISGDTAGMELGTLDPKDMMPVWEKMGRAKKLSVGGDHLKAAALLTEVVRVWPNDRTALRQLGICYLRAGDRRQAEKHLRKAVEIKPAADVCLLLAQITVYENRLNETGPLLDLALSVEPRHGGVYVARGDLFAARGLFQKALAAYRTAEEVDPYRAKGVTRQRIERLQARMSKSPPPTP